MQGPRTSSPGEFTPAIFPPSQLFWREREEGRRGIKDKKNKSGMKEKKKKAAKPSKRGRVSGAGRARQPPGAAGARLPTKGPRLGRRRLRDIRNSNALAPLTSSCLRLCQPRRGKAAGLEGGMRAGRWQRLQRGDAPAVPGRGSPGAVPGCDPVSLP